jgi:hypothetical protein
MNMKKIFISTLLIGLFISAGEALAICPLCTVAVGTGIGLSRWLGIDDSITGLWIGGLTVSLITWTISWLSDKKIKFKGLNPLIIITYYLLIMISVYYKEMRNIIDFIITYRIDNISLGIITGSLGFWFGAEYYYYLKEKNNNHAYFPFQKVIMPISPLIIASIVFYFLTK